ncbi:TetR family transcriptional regulator [Hydrogenispora ethanolica]|jgi:AcrR family transcriptional regulator|uniref:TetR family transcriptional regulator n=1 Tax=Hydrogenispora ethanolica TaxID=1082276 RepID=A0A4R1R335_HYDET|nr:TetR/AcrR family transcriptional regulator [Hydrogenispora ethanolica]TCL59810.1 TetR family transcriptional regulator [Hydrogenispora ethanolica]
MTRNPHSIPKDPETRKQEIIDAARELFLTQGFEATAVSDIVKKVGVAQGLFYYYFKSKNELLDAVVEHFAEDYLVAMEQIAAEPQLNALQKFQTILAAMFQFQKQNEEIIYVVHEKSNELLHHRVEHKTLDKLVPLYLRILEQGIREQLLDLKYPGETLAIILPGLGQYFHGLLEVSRTDPELFQEKIHAGLAVLEKALGAAPGSLQVEL